MRIDFKNRYTNSSGLISLSLLFRKICLRQLIRILNIFIVLTIWSVWAQEHDNNFQYPEVIHIETSEGRRATGFFYSQPDIVVTAFHIMIPDQYVGSVTNHISLYHHPLRQKNLIPATEIKVIALDVRNDLAVLKITGYQSDSFYPVNPTLKTEHYSKSSGITIVGYPDASLTVLKGIVSGDSNYDYPGSGSLMGFIRDNRFVTLKGMSGAPVFLSSDNSVVGVYTEGSEIYRGIPIGLDLFTSVTKLQDLLQNPSLSCLDISCVREELQNLRNQAEDGDRQAQYKLAFYSDKKEKWSWLERSAKNGHPNAQFILGRRNYFFSNGDMYWLEKSFDQDHSPAENFLEGVLLGIFKPL